MYIIALGDFVPTTISEGRLGLYQDDFKLVVDGFALEQALGSSVPGAVGQEGLVMWVGGND